MVNDLRQGHQVFVKKIHVEHIISPNDSKQPINPIKPEDTTSLFSVTVITNTLLLLFICFIYTYIPTTSIYILLHIPFLTIITYFFTPFMKNQLYLFSKGNPVIESEVCVCNAIFISIYKVIRYFIVVSLLLHNMFNLKLSSSYFYTIFGYLILCFFYTSKKGLTLVYLFLWIVLYSCNIIQDINSLIQITNFILLVCSILETKCSKEIKGYFIFLVLLLHLKYFLFSSSFILNIRKLESSINSIPKRATYIPIITKNYNKYDTYLHNLIEYYNNNTSDFD